MKCIAFKCENDDNDGTFVDKLCLPCMRKLTTGEGDYGTGILFNRTRTMFEDVGLFHAKMGLPVSEAFAMKRPLTDSMVHRSPGNFNDVEIEYRIRFLFEELQEFIEGTALNDIESQADALADLTWIALGTAHYIGIPFDRVWSEVRRANMEKRPWKEGDPLKPRNQTTALEVVKPEGWRAPDIDNAIWGQD